MAVSSKYTQDLSVQIDFFTFPCKWFLCFYFWAVIWSYIVDLLAALHELASASACTLLKARIIGARALKTLWRHLKGSLLVFLIVAQKLLLIFSHKVFSMFNLVEKPKRIPFLICSSFVFARKEN